MTKISTAKRVAAATCLLALALASACSRTEVKDCSKTDDVTLTANVKAELSKRMPKVAKDINVASKDRVVTLTGRVNYEPTQKYAGDTAKGVECVKDVVNNIAVVRSTEKAAGCEQGFHECCCPEGGCECVENRVNCIQCLPK
jgi:osmotically-inducible protein OsmY